ncbi:hypothetical protein CDD83_4384 [Cordyceps sp. RAO-2017]|nr:hypothetical protein CDD83_4384 [Cordyceps sp. RAO-2017]
MASRLGADDAGLPLERRRLGLEALECQVEADQTGRGGGLLGRREPVEWDADGGVGRAPVRHGLRRQEYAEIGAGAERHGPARDDRSVHIGRARTQASKELFRTA